MFQFQSNGGDLMMNIGLIGCGRIAHIHIKAYQSIKTAKVVGVADADINKAKAFAETYKIGKAFSDYRELFELKDLGFVDICTPTATHVPLVCEAAKAGINVLVEKPLGRNSQECERIVETARKQGIKVCVCHNQLFYPHVRRLKAIADSEDFNLISFRTSVRENFEWLKAHGLAHPWNVNPEHGGILWEVGTHLAYLQLHFLKYSVWDDFTVLLRTLSQRWGIMEISWIAKEPEMVYEIVSSDGKRIQSFLPHGYIIERTQEAHANVIEVIRNFVTDLKRLYKKWAKFAVDQIEKPNWGHPELIHAYIKSIEEDSSPPVTGIDGRNAIKLLECIEESLINQRPVKYAPW
jgi:predicted dehydrogenase